MERGFGAKWMTWMFMGLILAVGAFGILAPEKGFSESENRFLANRPDFTWKALADGSFGVKYEEYLSDQFPGRDQWIGIKVTAERLRGQRDVSGVYIGKDGYLIQRFEEEDIETALLDRNLDRLASFALGAEKRLGKGHVQVMLVPSASQVLKDKLPGLAAPFDQGLVVKQLRQRLSRLGGERVSSLVVPVEEALGQNREKEIYYRTDHHWTSLGAYYGYRAWAKGAGLKPWGEGDFTVETVSRNFHGTIYSKLNIPWQADEIKLYLPKEKQGYQVNYDLGEESADTIYQYQALKGKDQYQVFLDGNHGLTEIKNRNINGEGKDKKLLIIKDSFANSFAPFAINHFGTTYLADLRYLNVDMGKFMEEWGVTDLLVLYQIPGFSKEKTVSKLRLADGAPVVLGRFTSTTRITEETPSMDGFLNDSDDRLAAITNSITAFRHKAL